MADERYCMPVPAGYSDAEVAPLLCAGLIGYRALKLAGDGERIGLYGFGASAHIVCQVARHQGRRVFAFTRAEDAEAQALALELGAEWAGDSLGPAPGRARRRHHLRSGRASSSPQRCGRRRRGRRS